MSSQVMSRFVDRLAALSARTSSPGELALGAGAMLRSVLDFDHVLEIRECEPDRDHYRQHVLHVDPAGRFSVVALVWLPGHETPIHDHVAWCVAGVLTGREHEHRYQRLTVPCGRTTRPRNGPASERTVGRAVLRAGASVFNDAGAVSVLTSGPDIHQVTCVSAARTISIHVYGADISRAGSSIKLTYDRELVQ